MEDTVKKETVKKEKKSLGQVIDEHPKTVFWSRFVLWTIFACGLPFAFIVWRFQLFHTISKIQIGGWGLIAIIIVAFFVITVIRYVKIALSGHYSFIGQCLTGFCKVVIPLLVFYLILYYLREQINLMLQVIGCVILCEVIAIPLNPLPKWAYDCQKNIRVGERKEAFDYLLDGFFSRKKEEEHE